MRPLARALLGQLYRADPEALRIPPGLWPDARDLAQQGWLTITDDHALLTDQGRRAASRILSP